MIIFEAILYGIILNPYFITVFLGCLAGCVYINRVNKAYKIRKGK